MSIQKKLIVGVTAAALVAAGLYAQGPLRQRFQRRQALRSFVVGYLDLNDSQKAQAKSIFSAARDSAKPFVEQLQQGHQAMRDAVTSGAPDQQIEAIATQQGALLGKVDAVYAKAFREFYAVLTPDQQDKAKQLHDRIKERIQQRLGDAAADGF